MNAQDRLQKLGFTGNEAKAYLALLRCQPASAYEIAKQAGLPTSKIYETTARLTDRGIFQVHEDEAGNRQFFAMDPEDLMDSIRANTIDETRQLLPELLDIPSGNTSNLVWPLLDFDEVRSRSLAMINQASETILVSLWPEELSWCNEALQEAESRGVLVALVHFGVPGIKIGATYHHPVEKTLYAEKGGRGFSLVTDGKEVVIANFKAGNDVEGAWSRNESFVTVAEDYIKHDVYITKVTRFLGPEVTQRFGEDYVRLRNVFDAEA